MREHDHSWESELIDVLREHNNLQREHNKIMATLDADVQAATLVINNLVTALAAAGTGSGVSAADQTALETAIVAGQSALAPPPAS